MVAGFQNGHYALFEKQCSTIIIVFNSTFRVVFLLNTAPEYLLHTQRAVHLSEAFSHLQRLQHPFLEPQEINS